jgi:ribosomal protein S18 acetylase RimI-like enzyme
MGSSSKGSERIRIRTLNAAYDEPLLWTFLMHAAHEPSIDAVKQTRSLLPYVQGFGKAGDRGWVAEMGDSKPVGAAWMRVWDGPEKGFSYVNDETPEIAIATLPEFRGAGIGTRLLETLLKDAAKRYAAVSLAVRIENPALRFYQRLGFEEVPGSGVVNRAGTTSIIMIRQFQDKDNG